MTEIQNLSWAYVRTEAEKRLDDLRKKNDRVDLPEAETQALRGEIRALKWLLDLPTLAAQKLQTPPPGMPGSEQF